MKRNIVATLFIFIGITLMVSSLGARIYSKNKERKLIKEFSNEIILKDSQLDETNEANKEEKIVGYTNKEGDKIAIIEIPSIDVKSIIVEGINMDNLKYYVGHFKNTAMPGTEGNFAIAGHSSTIYNEIFNNLNKVNIEDEIKIKTLTEEFSYIVTEKFVVEPKEISVLDQDYQKKIMTIVTCTDKGKKRLIVKGEIKK